MRELLDSYPHKPYGWTLSGRNADGLAEYLRNQIAQNIENGGMVKTYSLGGRVIGVCATCPDRWASRELRMRAFRITHLMALGSSEAQSLIKSLVLNETLRDISGRSCLVAQIPYVDLTSVNALEHSGFVATQTSLVMARDLENADADTTADSDYEIQALDPDGVDRMLQRAVMEIPEGFLGWDSRLPHGTVMRIHSDWLRSCAHDHRLLVASDNGQPVGLLAEHVRTETSPYLGFDIGSIDLVATVPEYRSNGVAGRLVMDSVKQFRAGGVRLAELTVHSIDAHTAHSFQSQGFVTVGSNLTLINWRH